MHTEETGTRHPAAFTAVCVAALRAELPAWMQASRTVIAMLLALGIAFRLDLSSPASAAITVVVVSLPQSGMVLEKGFYRMLATCCAGLMTLLLVALFVQQRDLFVVMVALWIGTCAALTAWYRNFQSYGWALAGYTTCLIGFPAFQNADQAFNIVVDRISIVGLGIVCGSLVNATLFPNSSTNTLVQSVRRSFRDFTGFVRSTLQRELSAKALETLQHQLLQDVVALESTRSSSFFEDPETRIRTPRLRRFISQFMVTSTTVHTVNRLRNDLLQRDMEPVLAALEPLQQAFLQCLHTEQDRPPAAAAEALVVVRQLDALLAQWQQHAAAARSRLPADVPPAFAIELESGLTLLREFTEETRAFAETYTELRTRRSMLDLLRSEPPVARADRVSAALAGIRAALALLAVSAFWIASAWPEGFPAALLAAVACTLFVNVPSPRQSVWQMARGFSLGLVSGLLCFTLVLPALDGMLLLAAGLTPFLLIGAYLMARPQTAGLGSGYCLMFLVVLGLSQTMQYDIVAALNGGLAQIIGVLAAAIAFAVVFPADGAWRARRIERLLWQELYIARGDARPGARHRFESGVRDLTLQLLNLARSDTERRRYLLAGMTLLEAGRALLMMRMAATRHALTSWRPAVRSTLDSATAALTAPRNDIDLTHAEQDAHALQTQIEALPDATTTPAAVALRTALRMLQLALTERRGQLAAD